MASKTTTNTKLHLLKQGGPFELFQSSPIPTPAADEVIVKLKAIGLNPVDWKQMRLGMMIPSYPTILGLDGAGTIEAVGNDVKDVKVGDEVASHHVSTNDRAAAFQEFAAVKATEVALKPASWSFTDAASLPVEFSTAVSCLHESLEIALPFLKGGRSESEGFKPKSLLILGGSSSVGATAIALLRLALPSTTTILTTCSKPHHARVVDVIGATRAFDPKSSDVLDAIRSASPNGAGVDAILDVVNAVALQPSLLDLLAGPDKRFVELFTGRNLDTATVPADITHRIAMAANIAAKSYGANVYLALADLLAVGKFKLPTKVEVVGQGLEAIEPGLKRLMGGVSGTKLVVAL